LNYLFVTYTKALFTLLPNHLSSWSLRFEPLPLRRMPPRQRTMLPRARPEAIHCSPSALASLSLLFLEDLARRLSGHPLSDKYQTPTLVLFYVLRLYQAVLFNCFLRPICWPSCVLYPTTFLIQVVFFLSYLTYQNEGVTVF
jgi:hypothetical protein